MIYSLEKKKPSGSGWMRGVTFSKTLFKQWKIIFLI